MSRLPILIVGGAGKTGGRMNARLLARGVATRPFRATAATKIWRV